MPPRGTTTTRRRCVGLAAAALGTAALAAPAAQAFPTAVGISAGHNLTVFHNLDFVAIGGQAEGDGVKLEVFRGDHRIGYAAGPAVDGGEGAGLEVNHGPEGAPGPGDCFTRFTPDIQPGDRIRVTTSAPPAADIVDEVLVDDIMITSGPTVLPNGHVQVSGHARRADATGTPIPVSEMAPSAGALNTSKFRGPFTTLTSTDANGGWVGTFDPSVPFNADNDGREPSGLTVDERRELLMASEFSMGYGHVAVPPPEAQLFDGRPGDIGGPALGCEASAGQSNSVSSLDDAVINSASGDLVATGRAMVGVVNADGSAGADITGATVTATDSAGTTITGTAVNLAGDVQNWTSTFSRADVNTLLDGPITISAAYAVDGAGTVGGSSKTVSKDTIAPAAALSSLPAGSTVVGPASLTLSGEPGSSISYSVNGGPTGLYSGSIALPFGTSTFNVRVTDAAGNFTDSTMTFTVERAPVEQPRVEDPAPAEQPAAQAPAAQSAPAPAPAPQQQQAPSRSAVTALRTTRRVGLRKARRSGLSATFVAPSNGIAVARLFRTSRGARKLVAVKRVSVRGGSRRKVRFAGTGLKVGLYTIEVRTGASNGSLGEISAVFTRVTR